MNAVAIFSERCPLIAFYTFQGDIRHRVVCQSLFSIGSQLKLPRLRLFFLFASLGFLKQKMLNVIGEYILAECLLPLAVRVSLDRWITRRGHVFRLAAAATADDDDVTDTAGLAGGHVRRSADDRRLAARSRDAHAPSTDGRTDG